MKKLALLAFLLSMPLVSMAQEPQKPIKVGLVLSGGGAKGFAHIGVLKVLEEAGVKVDYIGGTSMGAIVGGLYASGYNARQIDSIFQQTDFDALLQDFIPRSSKSFYGKRNDELYAVSLPFNKFRIGIPTALSKGLYNYNLLAKLTHKVRHVRDFNQLPIPFLCVATNIETGEQVILNKGYLPQAMAASAAFPSLFAPIEIDGKMLIDGGVVNNYPIEEIKALGADVIIGVDVQDDMKDRSSLNDATRILVQISNLGMIQRMKEDAKKTDIYLKPDISSFGVISFERGQEIVKKGEDAAFGAYEKIKELAQKQQASRRPDLSVCTDSLTVNRITVNKLDDFTRAYVLGKLRFKPGKKISYNDLKLGMDNLSATQNFSAISYSLEPGPNDTDEIKLNLTENTTRAYLKFGVHYDNLYKTGVLANLTYKKLFLKNDVASFDMILGDNIRYNFDYYIDNGFYFSFGFKSRFTGFNRNVETDFADGALLEQLGLKSLNIDFADWTNQAYIQTIFVQKYLIGAGVEFKHLKIESETLQQNDPVFENSNYLSLFGYLKFDSFDNKYFPKRGWYFTGDFQWYLNSTDYTNQFQRFSVAKADIGLAQTFYKRFTLKLQAEAGVSIGEDSVPFFDFVLGGYGYSPVINVRPFYGYDFLSISGDSYIKATATADWEFFKKNHLNFSANGGSISDNLFEDSQALSKNRVFGYAVGYGLESVIGPIEVKYSWSPEVGRGFTWFSVGFWF
ncbi:PNPLA domain-containing protein [Flavobacterium longum]|uniref:patatin-like phospholipase family protein n=1 Tax=Flavobacterium longum TaxID=1299340 RepID=UPI0039E977A7